MTRKEWLTCNTPKPMLRFLIGTDEPRVVDVPAFPNCKGSDRKLRLFACACFFRLADGLPHPLARKCVSIAEDYADHRETRLALAHAASEVQAALDALEDRWRASQGEERAVLRPTHEALALAYQIARPETPKAAWYASSNACLSCASASQEEEQEAQADLLRDIFGPLSFRLVTLPPLLLTSTVVQLAQTIYEERAWDRMPILGDALEEAGCDNDEVLTHCRSAEGHTRGCWVVDLVLRKE